MLGEKTADQRSSRCSRQRPGYAGNQNISKHNTQQLPPQWLPCLHPPRPKSGSGGSTGSSGLSGARGRLAYAGGSSVAAWHLEPGNALAYIIAALATRDLCLAHNAQSMAASKLAPCGRRTRAREDWTIAAGGMTGDSEREGVRPSIGPPWLILAVKHPSPPKPNGQATAAQLQPSQQPTQSTPPGVSAGADADTLLPSCVAVRPRRQVAMCPDGQITKPPSASGHSSIPTASEPIASRIAVCETSTLLCRCQFSLTGRRWLVVTSSSSLRCTAFSSRRLPVRPRRPNMDVSSMLSPSSAQPAPKRHGPGKSVAFELLLDEGSKTRARIPLRVKVNPHDTTESIISTVKNFYGIYDGNGVSFEDAKGHTLIASFDNLAHGSTVLGEPFQMLPPHMREQSHSPSRSSSRLARKRSTSLSGSRKAKSEQIVSSDISTANVLQDGRRGQTIFDSSTLPLFVPPQVPVAASQSSISPQRRSLAQEGPSPFRLPAQKLYGLQQAPVVLSPLSHGRLAQDSGAEQTANQPVATAAAHGHDLRDRNAIHTAGTYRSRPAYTGQAVLPTPDPTVASCISDEDVARTLIALGDVSNYSHGRTSTSTMDDTFSGVADAASSTGATSDSDEYSDQDGGLPRYRKFLDQADQDYGAHGHIKHEYDEVQGPKTKKIKTKMYDGPAAIHRSAKSATANAKAIKPLKSRPHKKGCDRQRPCQRCKDAGIGIEGCISEDEGNGRKGRFGRHMGVPVKKAMETVARDKEDGDQPPPKATRAFKPRTGVQRRTKAERDAFAAQEADRDAKRAKEAATASPRVAKASGRQPSRREGSTATQNDSKLTNQGDAGGVFGSAAAGRPTVRRALAAGSEEIVLGNNTITPLPTSSSAGIDASAQRQHPDSASAAEGSGPLKALGHAIEVDNEPDEVMRDIETIGISTDEEGEDDDDKDGIVGSSTKARPDKGLRPLRAPTSVKTDKHKADQKPKSALRAPAPKQPATEAIELDNRDADELELVKEQPHSPNLKHKTVKKPAGKTREVKVGHETPEERTERLRVADGVDLFRHNKSKGPTIKKDADAALKHASIQDPHDHSGVLTACSPLDQLPSGLVGKLNVHASGKITLDWAGTSMEVRLGTDVDFLQDAVLLRTAHTDDSHESTAVPSSLGTPVVDPDPDPRPDQEHQHDRRQEESKAFALGQLDARMVVVPDWSKLYD
ncbi:hypothetical protein DV736_g4079, partial [Chaetothyriales sp. CBS 134916]